MMSMLKHPVGGVQKTAVQGRTDPVRHQRLQNIEAAIENKQRMVPERYDSRLLSLDQDDKARTRQFCLYIIDSRLLALSRG
jgi:hypothetical protein